MNSKKNNNVETVRKDIMKKNIMKSILYIPNEPIEVYYEYKQTYNMYPFKYFDLLKYFDKIYFSYLSPAKSNMTKKGKFYINRIKRMNIFKSKLLNYFNIFDYIKFVIRTRRLVKENDIKLIRAYNNHIEGFLACLIGKFSNVPVVVSVHNDFYYERRNTCVSDFASFFVINNIQRILEFFTNKMATKIFCVSNHLKEEIASRGNISKSKLEVIYNKVEMEKYGESHVNDMKMLKKKYDLKNKKVFLFIGRFVWQKNIFAMLRAFKVISLQHEDAILLMVSDGPLKNDILKFIKDNKLDSKVKLLGFVSNDLLPALFKSSDAFILRSFYEGFGIVLIEAQAAGCPTIVSDIPSVKDIVNSKNSLFFDPKSDKQLIKIMELFFSRQPAIRKSISDKVKCGLEDVKRFEWNRLSELEISQYKKILK
jgi:glycosyltransferase involved in cell wall biosynthesis